MTTIILVGAILASLALGVLAAHVICQTLFRLFRLHAQSAARERMQTAPRVAVEG